MLMNPDCLPGRSKSMSVNADDLRAMSRALRWLVTSVRRQPAKPRRPILSHAWKGFRQRLAQPLLGQRRQLTVDNVVRSEKRRVGKESDSTGKSRREDAQLQKNK